MDIDHTVLPPLSLPKEKSILIRTILCNHYSFLYILLKWNNRRKLDFAAAIAVTALSTYGSFNFLRKWVLGGVRMFVSVSGKHHYNVNVHNFSNNVKIVE